VTQLAGPDEQALVGAILAIVRERTGRDFSGYRAGTVQRRILNRMISAGISSMREYLAWLQRSREEAPRLLERLTIKVSRFYRNAATFDLLREQAIPRLAGERSGRPLRLWSAGCGCGEEPYTLAMLLDEAGIPGSVVGTDIDPAALDTARAGVYPESALGELPADLAGRYLEHVDSGLRGGAFRVRDGLRPRLRFSHHDVTAAVPPQDQVPFDLVCCRNILIYLLPDVQSRTLAGVCATIAPGGLLVLGEAEWPAASLAGSLAVVERRARVFSLSGAVCAGASR
jgi:chemotaxis protein methyltransferase CheR